ncbi:MAG: DUF308 domain-containing protein [Candidatus Lokiarchaeota archaeon]|nr:DUF308 domain-containing protein [Candidatus Lokiarchaeota archaeon]
MEDESTLKSINIIIGSTIFILSILVLILANVLLLSLMVLLSIAVLVSGIGRLYNAFYNKQLNKIGKILKFITGLLASIVGLIILILTIIDPSASIVLAISLIGYTFIVIGVARIFIGVMMENYKMEFRIFLIFIGVITMIFAFIVVLFPTLGYFVLILYISLTLMFNGLTRIIFALFGK